MAMEGRSNQGQTEVYALEGRINRWEGNKRKPRQLGLHTNRRNEESWKKYQARWEAWKGKT